MHKSLTTKTISQLSTAAMLGFVTLLVGILWLKSGQNLAQAEMALGQTAQTKIDSKLKAGTKLGEKLSPGLSRVGTHLGEALGKFSDAKTATRAQAPKIDTAKL